MTKLSTEQVEGKLDEYNEEIMQQLLPIWCSNIASNTEICRKAKNYDEAQERIVDAVKDDVAIVMRPTKCIVIGAGPSLKGVDLNKLADFTGDIIVCNKSYQELYSRGIQPDWVCMLDSDAISVTQFRWMDEDCDEREFKETKFMVSSTVYPETLATIARHSLKDGRLYAFNPTVKSGDGLSIDKTWEWMNFKRSLEHGGSVGTMAFNLAMQLGYTTIGVLGFDFYEEKSKNWTMQESVQREILYYPDTDEYVHMPFAFMMYSQWMFQKAQEYRNVVREVVNLCDSPIMRHTPTMKQEALDVFLSRA